MHRLESLRLNRLDTRVDIGDLRAEVRSVEPVAEDDWLARGALDVRAARG